MKLKLILTAVLLTTFFAMGQSTFIYDQQSSTDETPFGGNVPIQSGAPYGQSFTPMMTSVGVIRLQFTDRNPNNSLGATLFLNLRTNTVSGSILGSTAPVFMPDAFLGITNFFFSVPVGLTPGAKYAFEIVVQSGDQWNANALEYNYPGGTAFYNGSPLSGGDLWFREGVVVPEPSSALLVLIGGGVLFYARRKKIFSHLRYAAQ